MAEQPSFPGRADPGDRIQAGLKAASIPKLPVKGDAEAMGLVADPHEQVELGGIGRKDDGVFPARQKDPFRLLGKGPSSPPLFILSKVGFFLGECDQVDS